MGFEAALETQVLVVDPVNASSANGRRLQGRRRFVKIDRLLQPTVTLEHLSSGRHFSDDAGNLVTAEGGKKRRNGCQQRFISGDLDRKSKCWNWRRPPCGRRVEAHRKGTGRGERPRA